MKCIFSLFLVLSSLFGGIQAEPVENVVVLGGGVGALTSSVYLGRAGLHPVVLEGGDPGGLLTQSHSVQNWPGEMEIRGEELVDNIRKQAEANGATLLREEVVRVDFSKRPFTLYVKSIDTGAERVIHAQSVIIAMGTKPNFLGVPGEKEYWGRGVTNCAICDGNLYKDRIVGVVGGGDAAVLEALYLSNIAKEVHLFVRKGQLKAIETKRVEAMAQKPNVKIHYNTQVEKVTGIKGKLTEVTLKEQGKEHRFPLDGLFLAIGSRPNSQIFQKALKLDSQGYIQLVKGQQTSVEGVFAIGDIADKQYKQAITAAGDGTKAALMAQDYLAERSRSLAVTQSKAQPLGSLREVIEIKSAAQLEKELKTSEIPVVVDFYATWCGPCKQISPRIESSATQLSGKVKFLKVNVDQFQHLTQSYDIQAMPTVLFFDHSGKVVDRKVGSEEIVQFLAELSSNQ